MAEWESVWKGLPILCSIVMGKMKGGLTYRWRTEGRE